jgi:hypothetical protein
MTDMCAIQCRVQKIWRDTIFREVGTVTVFLFYFNEDPHTKSLIIPISVADPHHLGADPDPACHFGPNPDLHFDVDPDPDPSFQ